MRNRYTQGRKSFGKGILIFLFIVALALGAGYAATKYLITPYLFEDNKFQPETKGQEGEIENNAATDSILSDQQIIGETDTDETSNPAETSGQAVGPASPVSDGMIGLYCIQYGSYMEESRAEDALNELKARGIETAIVLKDGRYKVVGTPYISEDTARSSLAKMKAMAGDEIFLTSMEARIE